ncbi:hypothetical protein [Microbacterium excoecariae]|uniref:PH-like domain-containing protein n=1 Tax=Microbacterium excoecariae TaxID=2715210 RepID=UPI00140D43EB|nr:hypothetical protein [Microbacterium excoecariae]
MTRELALIVMVAVALVGLALMAWGWRRRTRRDAGIAVPLGEPTGELVGEFDGFYVATTRHDAPLDRVTARPLAFRSSAAITVTRDGLGLGLPGERPVFFPAASLTGAGRATWTIDRVVERDGLVLVAWASGSQIFDTYLRLQDSDPTALVAAIESILAAETPTGATR